MDLLHWVLFGVLPALGAMLLGVGAGGSRFLAAAIAVAVAVPFAMASGAPDWPWRLDPLHGEPRAFWFWAVFVAGLVGSLGDARWLPKPLAFLLELALGMALPWFLTGLVRRSWSFEQHVLWLGLGVLAVCVLWHVLREAGRARPGLLVPFVGAVTLGVDAWLLRSHGVPTWELAGVGSVALAFALLTALWRRPLTCGTGAALCIVVVHVGCLWCGRALRDLHSLSSVLALLQPLPLWCAACASLARRPKTAVALAVLGCVGLGAATVWRG